MLQITLSLLQLFSPVVLVTLKAKCHPDQRGCEAMSQVPTRFRNQFDFGGPFGLKSQSQNEQSRQPMLQITLSLLQLFSPIVLVTLKAKCHPDQRGCEAMSQVPTAFGINLILEGLSG